MIPFIRKYRVEKVSDIVGQDSAVKELNGFISGFKGQKKHAALIYGPSGTGKTISVYAIAKELNLEVVEVNASDFRNKARISSILGPALKQRSLFSKGKVILVDEIDGLSGDKDRGGIQEVIRLIENASFPIILAANNPYDYRFSSLRSKAVMVKFEPLDYASIFRILKPICQKEKIRFDEEALKQLARHAGGDARGAINDLQLLAQKTGSLTKDSLNELSDREKVETMFNALLKIFKTTKADIALAAFDNVEEDFDQQFLWIDENLPKEYEKPEDLVRAYDAISRADVYRGRIRRRQHWHFLVYINALLTAGIATAKHGKYHKITGYKPVSRLLKIWWANQKALKKKAIAAKIAAKTHSSSRRALKDTLPFVQQVFKKSREMADALAKEFDLDSEEVGWLRKQ